MKQQSEKMIANALECLKNIPQMKDVLENLPDIIKYSFSQDTPGVASFNSDENLITIKPSLVASNNPQERLSFYVALVHELCHANQKKEGLYYNDLIDASFGDTFRIAQMMEIDSHLLRVIIENELLKREEFQGCISSVDCRYYQKELQRANGNISQANTNFVLSYWQNAKNHTELNQDELCTINRRYFFYVEQAYHHALLIHNTLLIHNPNFKQTTTGKISAQDSIHAYLRKMSLTGVQPELFLQDGFDNVQTTNNWQEGITILNPDGSKYLNLAPMVNPLFDKVTFFKNNEAIKFCVRNGITGEMRPWLTKKQCPPALTMDSDFSDNPSASQKVANLSALEIAIENRNMNRIQEIISKDPSVINRQTMVSKNFPLLMAIQNDNVEAISFILSKNPNLLLATEDGKSVFTELSKLSDVKIRRQIRTLHEIQFNALINKWHKR